MHDFAYISFSSGSVYIILGHFCCQVSANWNIQHQNMANRAYIKICLNSKEIANRPDMT